MVEKIRFGTDDTVPTLRRRLAEPARFDAKQSDSRMSDEERGRALLAAVSLSASNPVLLRDVLPAVLDEIERQIAEDEGKNA